MLHHKKGLLGYFSTAYHCTKKQLVRGNHELWNVSSG